MYLNNQFATALIWHKTAIYIEREREGQRERYFSSPVGSLCHTRGVVPPPLWQSLITRHLRVSNV